MTDQPPPAYMMQPPVYGDADNGERVALVVLDAQGNDAHNGVAGVRYRDGGREVAFLGVPRLDFPARVLIDLEEATATAKLADRVAGFTVLWVPDA